MGLGTLNVWVHDAVDHCKISDEVWFVTVTYCNGVTVEWCGKTYGFMEAKCGHTEIELPPGCYIVFASQFVFLPGSQFPFIISTHFSVVMVECDQKACVHLYSPTPRQQMSSTPGLALSLVEKQGVPREKAERLAEAVNSVLEHLPKTGQDAALEQLFEEARRKQGGR
jgi:hypothetical protein